MDVDLILRWLHVLGACVLIGTGAGIAFFMVMAHRTGRPAVIAHTAGVVVIADTVVYRDGGGRAADHRGAAGAVGRVGAERRLDRSFGHSLFGYRSFLAAGGVDPNQTARSCA